MNCKLRDVVRWREKNGSNRFAAYSQSQAGVFEATRKPVSAQQINTRSVPLHTHLIARSAISFRAYSPRPK